MPYLITQRCRSCGNTWKWRSRAQSTKTLGTYNPPCPKCAKVSKDIGLDVAAGKAPGIGGSNLGRAMDEVADQTMADYGMTNLSSARVGEAMAPKLAPVQQAQADNMFNGGNVRNMRLPRGLQGSTAQVLGRAVAGQFRHPDTPDPVAPVVASAPFDTSVTGRTATVPVPKFDVVTPGGRGRKRGF